MNVKNRKGFAIAFGFLFAILFGVFACNGSFPTQSKTGLPTDHTILKSYAYHQSGLYVPANKCTTCHGDSLKGGVSMASSQATPSCFQCHSSIWGGIDHSVLLTGIDGQSYHKTGYYNPQTNCVECHGNDLKGGSYKGGATPSCYKCHSNLWAGFSDHTILLTGSDGSSYHKAGYAFPQTNCVQCHGSDLKGGTYNGSATKSCYQCHSDIWTALSDHTILLTGIDGTGYHKLGYNDPATNCVQCHGSDLKGGTYNGSATKSCYQCHNSAVWDWRSTHTVSIGSHWHKPGFFNPTTNCVQCHGSDLKGGSSGSSCYNSSCHSTAVWDWKSTHTKNKHGVLHMSGSSSACTKCHGADLRGGISGSSCYQCHSNGTGDDD